MVARSEYVTPKRCWKGGGWGDKECCAVRERLKLAACFFVKAGREGELVLDQGVQMRSK
jgi:hypothetical protein